ncbi:hypothetical protein BDZ94DRAFT_1269286 [Collybia nuda]|uniref:Uncharacterized protein n=1 Tax=Collybia nuda TaxID=64659 RepID=A0A9P5XWD4_9AGAR|nr:hypothetical protein BDZ94DRAFT_1269286 [Collybia nuda]
MPISKNFALYTILFALVFFIQSAIAAPGPQLDPPNLCKLACPPLMKCCSHEPLEICLPEC